MTVVLAFLQSAGLVFLFHTGQSRDIPDIFPRRARSRAANVLLIVLVMTAGTALIMWLGELITQRGVGNGMSILIFTSRHLAGCRSRAARSCAAGGPGAVHRRSC